MSSPLAARKHVAAFSLGIEGMTCASCVTRVEKAISADTRRCFQLGQSSDAARRGSLFGGSRHYRGRLCDWQGWLWNHD